MIRGFAPVVSDGARVLILGTMPGEKSLEMEEYYAHPRNDFWMLMGEFFGATPDRPYEDKCKRLQECGVALWDVLATCERAGSLDHQIETGSATANDLKSLVERYSGIRRIFFNGKMAEEFFMQLVDVRGFVRCDGLVLVRLPSTSPANTRFSFEEKRRAWSVVKEAACQRKPGP